MIWSSDPKGAITYASAEWVEFTGQSVESALVDGWLDYLHPDDVSRTVEGFKVACELGAPFTVWYRLRHRTRGYVAMMSSAMPSISLIDGSFIGFLGTLVEAELDEERGIEIGQFLFFPSTDAVRPSSPVDIVADYLLLARATAKVAGEVRLIPSLDFAISEVTRRLRISSNDMRVH